MRVTVRNWGESASTRISAESMEAARLHLDDQVDVREEGELIVINPVCTNEYDLAQLLADITPENLQGAVDFWTLAGQESLYL